MGYPYDVFISYAHEDSAFAQILENLLDRAGLNVWRDEERLRGGDPVQASIDRAIHESRHAIAIASEASLRSGWTHWEAGQFRGVMSDTRRLVPVFRVDRDPSEFAQDLRDLIGVKWLPDATDVDAHFWQLWCALRITGNGEPGKPETWAEQGRKRLGWPAAPAPITAEMMLPAGPGQPTGPTPSSCLRGPNPVLLLDRDAQWSQLELIVKSPNSEVAFVIGETRQAHDVFLRRVTYCSPTDPPCDVRAVRWPPMPPRAEADYVDALARTLDCAPGDLATALASAVRDRNLVLVHRPVVEAALDNEAFARYYGEWLPRILQSVDPDPRADDRIGAVKVIQAVAWAKTRAWSSATAGLLRGVGVGGRWIDDAVEGADARRLMSRLKQQAPARLRVTVLDELEDVSQKDLDRWVHALPASVDGKSLIELVRRRCRDTAAIFDALSEKLGTDEEWLK